MKTTDKKVETLRSSKKNQEVKIFIVDDDPMYRQAIEYRLKQNRDYSIYSFKTGEECFRHFELLDPDIVVLDYCLNDLDPNAKNGLEVLRKLKEIKPELSILMLSGKENFDVATSSIKHGAFDYIVKNESAFIRLQNLINKIRNNISLERWARRKGNHLKLIGILTLLVVIGPILSNYFIPSLAPAITIGLFILLIFFFAIVNRLEKNEWMSLLDNMRSDH
jgi:two-component system OmpR family response regulator